MVKLWRRNSHFFRQKRILGTRNWRFFQKNNFTKSVGICSCMLI